VLEIYLALSFKCESYLGTHNHDVIINAIGLNLRNIKALHLKINLDSSASLLIITEYCTLLEALFLHIFGSLLELSLSDMESIAALPRLNDLDIFCKMQDGAIIALAQCTTLNHLSLHFMMDLTPVLAAIGRNLVSLSIRIQRCGIKGVLTTCPGLEHLCLQLGEAQVEDQKEGGQRRRWEQGIKKGLKKLKSLSIDYGRVVVGCEWAGYEAW
jgi:hypothetical protein